MGLGRREDRWIYGSRDGDSFTLSLEEQERSVCVPQGISTFHYYVSVWSVAYTAEISAENQQRTLQTTRSLLTLSTGLAMAIAAAENPKSNQRAYQIRRNRSKSSLIDWLQPNEERFYADTKFDVKRDHVIRRTKAPENLQELLRRSSSFENPSYSQRRRLFLILLNPRTSAPIAREENYIRPLSSYNQIQNFLDSDYLEQRLYKSDELRKMEYWYTEAQSTSCSLRHGFAALPPRNRDSRFLSSSGEHKLYNLAKECSSHSLFQPHGWILDGEKCTTVLGKYTRKELFRSTWADTKMRKRQQDIYI